MDAPESRRKTADAVLRLLFDWVDSGGVFHRERSTWPTFAFEIRVLDDVVTEV